MQLPIDHVVGTEVLNRFRCPPNDILEFLELLVVHPQCRAIDRLALDHTPHLHHLGRPWFRGHHPTERARGAAAAIQHENAGPDPYFNDVRNLER